jgi:hypothetical protein
MQVALGPRRSLRFKLFSAAASMDPWEGALFWRCCELLSHHAASTFFKSSHMVSLPLESDILSTFVLTSVGTLDGFVLRPWLSGRTRLVQPQISPHPGTYGYLETRAGLFP